MSGGPTRALAAFAAAFPGVGIPEAARNAAARSLLDTVACALAGLREESSRTLLQVVGDEAAKGPCTAVGLPRRITPREAALINGGLAHALDFDDTHDVAVLHPGVAVIPAALAVAESRGRGGQALIDAIVVGYDVQVRVALAARKAPGHTGWHYTSACGIFGAAAAAGRLLGLEGRFGFFPVYLRDYDPTPVLESLGQRFEVERTSLKPFPTCRFTHAPIAALQQILHERALQASHIEEIEARITGAAYSEVCEPLAQKVRPFSRVHAQFSLPYALACVADHGTVGLADLTDEGIHREGVPGLAERVRCIRDPDLEARWGEKIGEAEVRVRTRDGAVVAARALPPGGPEHPMTDADRAAKTKQCLDWGAPDLEPERLARTVDAMRYTSDVSALSRSFTPAEERRRCGSS